MSADGYEHPASGRTYRQGDPAHRFAQLSSALARQCDEFLHHYRERMEDGDYLAQTKVWLSDPHRIARSMQDTIEALDEAYTSVVVDETSYQYGLGEQDDDWQRKYGPVDP